MILTKRAIAATRMATIRAAAISVALVCVAVVCVTGALGCSTTPHPAAADGPVNIDRHAFTLAETNRTRINKIRLGQTLVEVERIMGPPERRAARLRYDGVSVEEWSYITDYVRKMDALILFVGGKVQEIQSTPWEEQDRDSTEDADAPAEP